MPSQNQNPPRTLQGLNDEEFLPGKTDLSRKIPDEPGQGSRNSDLGKTDISSRSAADQNDGT